MRALVAACWWLTIAAATEVVDLLGALSLQNTSRPGVSVAPGLQPFQPSYILQGDRELQVPSVSYARAIELLRRSPEFTILATLKQDPTNSGTIVAFSHGVNRYLELQSSGRRDEIRFHYVAAGGSTTRVETFPYRLADGEWHRLALSVSGAQAQLLVDCHPLYRRTIPQPDRNFTLEQLSLWVGQRNSKHSMFKGTLQDVRLITGTHGYLIQCPGLDSDCPTCGQFSLLQTTVQELATHIKDLTSRLVQSEARIDTLEQCDCQKSCYSNGTLHADGATWQMACNKCTCVHGDITCRPIECEVPQCKTPVLRPGECCPTCLKNCLMSRKTYSHGERVIPKNCTECICHDGSMRCQRVEPDVVCPPLPCEPHEQFSVLGECCKFCPGVDYCSKGHSCHENATCMNLENKYICKCNVGFQGNGMICDDIDECATAGGLEGHHCHSNTICINEFGSYRCQCLPGYTSIDKYHCVEVDECSLGNHSCHERASCENTAGSYICKCMEGYTGDGYECQPICTGGCLNGGLCTAVDKCTCREGMTGERCESDINECSGPGPSPCPDTAECVNMPGWYYCKCKNGYTSDNSALHCVDIDECLMGSHTCHPSAKCRNTEGSYRCECYTPDCELSCMSGGTILSDGTKWLEGGGCRACECRSGVVICSTAPCSCDGPANTTEWASPECCPQCDLRYDCTHQEMKHVNFKSGERWLYQCQTCECLLGEVDCWETECGGCGPASECPHCQDRMVGMECSSSFGPLRTFQRDFTSQTSRSSARGLA